ncbi:MAG: hypothetical protein IPQ02_16225 [Saprospiraceae bacterium]|nr:hypothetical protein [Candidatus Defluviibacterium haderslevense]
MKDISLINFPFTSVLSWRTRQTVQIDIEDSPMQKIKKYRQKLMPANLCFRILACRVGIIFPLSFKQLKKGIYPTIQLFCYFFLILGCSPNDDKGPYYDTCGFLVPECDPVSFLPDVNGVLPITETTCLKDIGTMNLLGDSKKYLWFNCASVKSLLYEDSLGNRINLKIISKIHKLTNTYAYSFSEPGCSEFIYASVDEVMEVTLVNQQINIKFKLELAPWGTSPENYDGLEVSKTTFDDQRPFFGLIKYCLCT